MPAALLAAHVASAEEPPRAVLLEPRASSRFASEIFARLRGELEASNVELHVLPAPDDLSGMEAVRIAGQGLDPDVVLLVQEHAAGPRRTEELWLSDRLAQRMFVQRIDARPSDPARSARWVAVQAAELVRARIAEARIGSAPIAATPLPPPPPPFVLPPEPGRTSVEAGLGLDLLHGFRGLADTWVPMARVSVSLLDNALGSIPLSLHARASLGVGVERGLVSGARSAEIRQSFGTLDVLVRFAPKSFAEPFLSIGGGVFALDVAGAADAPYENHSARTWSGQNTVGTGLWLRPFDGAAIVADVALMDVWSETVVQFGSRDVVHVGAPIGLLGVTAAAVF